MGVRELVDRELGAIAPTSKPRLLTLAELASMPITKADLAREAAEFKEVCARAEAKGNRALELLRSAEFTSTPEEFAEWVKDYEPTK